MIIVVNIADTINIETSHIVVLILRIDYYDNAKLSRYR